MKRRDVDLRLAQAVSCRLWGDPADDPLALLIPQQELPLLVDFLAANLPADTAPDAQALLELLRRYYGDDLREAIMNYLRAYVQHLQATWNWRDVQFGGPDVLDALARLSRSSLWEGDELPADFYASISPQETATCLSYSYRYCRFLLAWMAEIGRQDEDLLQIASQVERMHAEVAQNLMDEQRVHDVAYCDLEQNITVAEVRRAVQSGYLVVEEEMTEVTPVERIALSLEAFDHLHHLSALVMVDLARLALSDVRLCYNKPLGLLIATCPTWSAPRQMRPVKMVRYLEHQIGRPLRWLAILAEVLGEIECGQDRVSVEAYLGEAGAVAYDLATDAGIRSCMADESGILAVYCSMKGLEQTNGVLLFRFRGNVVARSKVSLVACPSCRSFQLHVDRRYVADTRLAGKVDKMLRKVARNEGVYTVVCSQCGRALVKRTCSTVLPYEDAFDREHRRIVDGYCYLPARGQMLDQSSAQTAHQLFDQLDISLAEILSSAGVTVYRPADCADRIRKMLENMALDPSDPHIRMVTSPPEEVTTLHHGSCAPAVPAEPPHHELEDYEPLEEEPLWDYDMIEEEPLWDYDMIEDYEQMLRRHVHEFLNPTK